MKFCLVWFYSIAIAIEIVDNNKNTFELIQQW